MSVEQHRDELADLRERYADLVASHDDASDRLDAAEAAEAETRREARTRHALGELTEAELAVEERAIDDRLAELRSEAERLDDAVAGVGEKVEAAGEALAEEIRAEAALPIAAVDAQLAPLRRRVEALESLRLKWVAEADVAEQEARGIVDGSKVLPESRRAVEERQRKDGELRRWHDRHPEAAELAARGPAYLRVR